MTRPCMITAFVVLVAILAASVGGYLLFAELDRANTELRATAATLRATAATLRTTAATLQTTETDLGTTREHLEDRTASLNKTTAVLAQTTADFAAERTVRSQLQQDNTALTASLDTATAENTTLTTGLATAVGVQRQLQSDLSTANAQVISIRTEKLDVEERHRALEAAVGTVTNLEGRVKDLQDELDALRERRRPLILAKDREGITGFKCTGSMEPVLTCLDTATWAQPLGAEDIVVGSTISFPSVSCWPDETDSRFVSHRVMDIRVIDGVAHYWPKGDGNTEADGCWVLHTAVDGYIIAIHKDTRPANKGLRNRVNSSEARYVAARDARVAAWSDYLAENERLCCLAGAPRLPRAT